MSFSSNSGYDLYTTTWSPEGKVYQVEYAGKHVDNKGSLALAICCKDGVVLANQIQMIHRTVKYPSPTFEVIHAIDDNLCLSFCGMRPDGRCLVSRAREECQSYKDNFGLKITADLLATRVGSYMSAFTEYFSLRPFGVTAFLAGYTKDKGPRLWVCDAAGETRGYFACAVGQEKQTARTELEKLVASPEEITVEKAKYELVKILKKCYDANSSKRIELEVGILNADGFSHVPYGEVKELETRADAELDEDSDDEEEEEDD